MFILYTPAMVFIANTGPCAKVKQSPLGRLLPNMISIFVLKS